MTLREG